MPSIGGVIELLGELESEKLSVHEERCVAVRNRHADCLRCAEVCTSGAIRYADNRLTVDPSRCIGCGTCATACPTCAIEIKTPSDEELVDQVRRVLVASDGHPVFACERALDHAIAQAEKESRTRGFFRKRSSVPFDGAQICCLPCLGRIDESLLCALAAYGTHDVEFVCCGCETCEHRTGGMMLELVRESASSLIEAFGGELPMRISDELPDRVSRWTDAGASASGMDRRAFLEVAKAESLRAAEVAMRRQAAGVLPTEDAEEVPHPGYAHVDEAGTLSHLVPTRRTRLYNCLRHIGEPVCEQVESRVIGAVEIDGDACDSCRMCAVFCPTGALVKMDGEDLFGVMHRPSLCVQCRLCESICPTKAITVSSSVPAARFMGQKAVCFRMRRPTWEPNRPKSMFEKFHQLIGTDVPMDVY